MKNRLTLRQREFCRLYADGIPATQSAHRAGFARSTCETNVARLLNSPLVQARILRLRNHTLIRLNELEEMRDTAYEIMRNNKDDKVRLQAIRRLESLKKYTIHPLDDQQFIDTLVMESSPSEPDTELDTQTPQNDVPASESIEYQQQLFPEETDTLPDGKTPAFDQRMHPLKPIEPPKPPVVITVRNLLPKSDNHPQNHNEDEEDDQLSQASANHLLQ